MFRQARPYWCGPAALVALQLELGRGPELTQAEWAQLAGTTRDGTGERGMQRCLALLAPFYVTRQACRFTLATVFDQWRNHWIAVRREGVAVLMLDPWDGGIVVYPWAWFRLAYFDPPGSYALVIRER